MQEFTGGCLCGAVRYRLTGPLADVIACHCTQCRRHTGHYAAHTSVPLESFQLERDSALAWYRSSREAERGFCRVCGSTLFWRMAAEARASINEGNLDSPPTDLPIAEHIYCTAGTLDGPTSVSITEHIFCKYKGDYYEIGDSKPQKEEW
ncbi:MAG TPA: GFA family protein [Burkholderiaceae bacterium]|nr:GFA family protein [Burkholderiaceae bacterium]